MLPDLTVLLALIAGLNALESRVPGGDPAQALMTTLLVVIVFRSLARGAGRRAVLLASGETLPAAEAGVRWLMAWPLLGWLICLQFAGWPVAVIEHVPRTWWIARLAIFFAPAAWMFTGAWRARGEAEAAILAARGIHPTTQDKPVARAVRRNMIALLPLAVIVAVFEGIWVLGALGVPAMAHAARWIEAMPLLNLVAVFAIVLIAMPFLPWLIARTLKTKPLPAGPFRDRLELAASRIGLRYRDILLWPTGGKVLNAMVVGFTPGTRRIFFTDGILRALPEDELMAVFFHEAGHAKKHHLPLLLLLFLSVAMVFHFMGTPLMQAGIPPIWIVLLQLAVLWFVLLGWVSRRFEREADLYGAAHASILEPDAPEVPIPNSDRTLPRGAALMIRALERLQRISGKGASHRHGTIQDRMQYIAAHATDAGVRENFQRSQRSLLLGIAALATLAAVGIVQRYPSELRVARAQFSLDDALRQYDLAMAESAKTGAARSAVNIKRHFEASYTGFITAAAHVEGADDLHGRALRLESLFDAGDVAMHGLGDPERARPHFEKALVLARETEGLGRPGAIREFQSLIELGRIAAWTGQERDVAEGYLMRAAASDLVRGGESSEPDLEWRRYYGDRLRLLQATIDARLGGEAGADLARPILMALKRSANKDMHWEELREDARIELRRLNGR